MEKDMSDETSIEDKTAEIVAERRKRGPNRPKLAIAPADEPVAEEADEAVVAPRPKTRLFPVILERNYHPIKDFLLDGKEPGPEQRVKVFAGQAIDMDLEEAREIIAKGIARRNDPIG
jgi:hypothetical protein